MIPDVDPCVARYRDLKNLKLVGSELGIPWQTVYTRLKRAGEPITGDKSRYGSETDRLAARAERWFQAVVPEAVDQNQECFQAPVDFIVGAHRIDVKVSRPHTSKSGVLQWCWSIKKQASTADFFVCIALLSVGDDLKVFRTLAIPGELARHYQTIRISWSGSVRGKWSDYEITPSALSQFFAETEAL